MSVPQEAEGKKELALHKVCMSGDPSNLLTKPKAEMGETLAAVATENDNFYVPERYRDHKRADGCLAKACWRGEWDLTQKRQVWPQEPDHTHHDGCLKRTHRVHWGRLQAAISADSSCLRSRAVKPPESEGWGGRGFLKQKAREGGLGREEIGYLVWNPLPWNVLAAILIWGQLYVFVGFQHDLLQEAELSFLKLLLLPVWKRTCLPWNKNVESCSRGDRTEGKHTESKYSLIKYSPLLISDSWLQVMSCSQDHEFEPGIGLTHWAWRRPQILSPSALFCL